MQSRLNVRRVAKPVKVAMPTGALARHAQCTAETLKRRRCKGINEV